MKIEEIIEIIEDFSELICLRGAEISEDDKIITFDFRPSLYSGVLIAASEVILNMCSINRLEDNLKKINELLKNKVIRYKTYEECYKKPDNLPREELLIILLQEFYDKVKILQNERRETHKKDMQEIRNFSLVNKNSYNDLLCFLGNKMFPNHATPQNGYELLPGALRESFFSRFIFTDNYLRENLQIDYRDR